MHINSWVVLPVVDYIFHGAGLEATGDWVPFRELENGGPRERSPSSKSTGSFPGAIAARAVI